MALLLFPRQLQYTSEVINIEVPVRVFDGDRFVDNLGLTDFEVFEDGKSQKIVALYLIRKTQVQKKEATVVPTPAPKAAFAPETARNFLLVFEVHDPMPKIDEAIDYFFKEVFRKGDQVTVVSPKGRYHFRRETSDRMVPDEVARQLKSRLRKDIIAGSTDYRRLIQDIKDLIKTEGMDADVKGQLIMNDVRELRDRITVSDTGIRSLAQTLKAQQGRKIVFLFYQKEEIVIPSSKDAYSEYDREARRAVDYNVKDIERLFSDASMTVNLVFLTNSTTSAFDISDQLSTDSTGLADLSGSIYGTFREVSRATGGTTESSANALAAFKKTVTASENYYLLYYVPSEYKADGKFKQITVKVKGKNYQVSNRSGYIAK